MYHQCTKVHVSMQAGLVSNANAVLARWAGGAAVLQGGPSPHLMTMTELYNAW